MLCSKFEADGGNQKTFDRQKIFNSFGCSIFTIDFTLLHVVNQDSAKNNFDFVLINFGPLTVAFLKNKIIDTFCKTFLTDDNAHVFMSLTFIT